MNNNEMIGKIHNSIYQLISSGGQKKLTHANTLRFSKSGGEDIEKAYATHYVSAEKVSGLKPQ